MALLGIESARLVLPGTHSKWVRATAGRIEGFSTFMTGEFYSLLRRHSILARTLPDDDGELDAGAFEQGFRYALHSGNLLRAAFSARTLSLFDRLPARAAPSYLSGLVIGEEIRSQQFAIGDDPVIVVGSPALTRRYELALRLLGVRSVPVGSEAAWHGLWAIARNLEHTA
jgi:2-dehydro-3-deoxygalactonokinase